MSDDASIAVQSSLNAKAREDYKALLPTLDPEVRALLMTKDRATGQSRLNMQEGYETFRPLGEEAPTPFITPDVAADLDREVDELCETFDLSEGQARGVLAWHQAKVEVESNRTQSLMLARALGALLQVDNLKQEVIAILFATGTASANGLTSMRKACALILKPNGVPVTVASLSKRASWWLGFLGLPPVEGMKSARAVDAYHDAAPRGHATRRANKLTRALECLEKSSTESTATP